MSMDTPYLQFSKSWQSPKEDQDIANAKLRNELDAACRHVEALCKERTLYRVVADRAREFETITSTSNRIALVDALKELDEARR
jgi:hypothetical protein